MGAVYNAKKAFMVSATTNRLEQELLERIFGSDACGQLLFSNIASNVMQKSVQAYECTSQEAKTL